MPNTRAQAHPRRRPLKASDSQAPSFSKHPMQLRKSETFSSPKPVSTDICVLDLHSYTPQRSPTSSERLEELLRDAEVQGLQGLQNVQRMTNLIKDFEKTVEGHPLSGPSILADRDVLPMPSFILDRTSMDCTSKEINPKSTAVVHDPHEHASDSGLGTSLSGSKHRYCDGQSHASSALGSSVSSTHAAITRSFSAFGAMEEKPALSEYASHQIYEYIIEPILAEESLKDFHPLIKDVPRRIGQKNISNLRDLEKTLIFLAPEFSATPISYRRFCERSITLLQATVDCLPERDQVLETDRPYTNNYFIDLLEQIRRYAAIMAATQQKEGKGETLDEMDYSHDEKLTLRGGLSYDGRPAQLVREKNGRIISLSEDVDGTYGGSSKRVLSGGNDTDDEGIIRSMARRRKSDKLGDVMHACSDCRKEFKRPCDLTKHEKTHSRPWKCNEPKCKYFEFGWPTEKERDRHINDKHSAAPLQYRCLYHPCTYASKRESNCKQHMEKAHGWEYVRSKNNGRKKVATTGNVHSPSTPLTPFLGTPASAIANTPMTPFMASPPVPTMNEFGYTYDFGTPALSAKGFQDEFRRDSVATTGSIFTNSPGPSPVESMLFENATTPEDVAFNHIDTFNCSVNNTFGNSIQQLTPAMSGYDNFNDFAFSENNTIPTCMPHLSPGGQPDITLYGPTSNNIDEGFNEVISTFQAPIGDFTLYADPAPSNNMSMDANDNLFPELDQLGGQFDQIGSNFENNLFTPSTNMFSSNFDDMLDLDTNFNNLH